MKRALLATVVMAILVLTLSAAGQANSFLQVSVNGGPFTFFSSTGNTISTGTFSIDGVTFNEIDLVGNQPGSTQAFSTDTKTAITNGGTGPANITVQFASNGFSSPAGSPLLFNASQTVNVTDFGTDGAITQLFTGFGDASNSLFPGMGVPAPAPPCTVAPGPPTSSCATSSPVATFARSGNFALSGVEAFTLQAGQVADFSGSVATVGPTVPEPSSLLLVGIGLILIARRRLRSK